MTQNTTVLANAVTKYFGTALADKRQPIKTDLVDQKIIGAVAGRTNVMKSKYNAVLKANKGQGILHVILKATNGTLSINTLFPFTDTRLNRRGTGTNSVGVYALTSSSSSEYERSLTNQQDAPKALVFGNGNLPAFGRLFASERLNGSKLSGELTQAYIPTLGSVWAKDYFEVIGGKQLTVGNAINSITLKIWSTLQNALLDTTMTEVDKQEAYAKTWNTYQNLYKVWISKGYLDLSTVLYSKPNSVFPVVAAFLGTTSTADELNVQKIIGTEDGRTSEMPILNEASLHAIILDDEQDEYGKHQFGIFKLATLSADNHETLEDEDEISKTAEIATRAVMIFDGAGKQLKARVRVVDEVYGNSKPVKHSRSFFNLAVGSIVHLDGELTFRTLKEGSQAVIAEIECDGDFMGAQANTNMIVGDIATSDMEEIDLTQLTLDADVLTATQPESNEPAPVLQSDTQSDDEMNQ